MYQVIGDENDAQSELLIDISPLLLLGTNDHVLPSKHFESANSNEFTLKYSEPGNVTEVITQLPFNKFADERSTFVPAAEFDLQPVKKSIIAKIPVKRYFFIGRFLRLIQTNIQSLKSKC